MTNDVDSTNSGSNAPDRSATGDSADAPVDLRALLPYRLLLLSNALGKGAVRLYSGKFGVPLAEWRLLAALYGNEPGSVNGLAAALATDKGWISRTAATLVEKGLCRMTADAGDARRSDITMTRAGRALYERIMPAAIERHRQLASVLSRDELALFNDMLARLQRRAELQADGALGVDAGASSAPARGRGRGVAPTPARRGRKRSGS